MARKSTPKPTKAKATTPDPKKAPAKRPAAKKVAAKPKKPAGVAQQAERRHPTSEVPGSTPGARSKKASPLDTLSTDDLCTRLRSGETLTAIAISLKVGKATLIDWIAADIDRSARAREARAAAAAMYDEQAEELIERARDPFELAKAKEQAHHLRWRASKVNPAAYGDKVQVDAKVDTRSLSDEALAERLAKFGVVAIKPQRQDEDGCG